MNDLLEQLNTSHITLDPSDISLKHPRYELYRTTPQICDQENRRKEWLENLKKKRNDHLNSNRDLEVSDNVEPMDIDRKKKASTPRPYKGWLMLSEWLIEVPNDLKENWICTICPEGTRALVVAEAGKTMAYRRNGRAICSDFPSWLPGGSANDRRGRTVIDTIFHQKSKTFYVLDVIYWGIATVDWEAEMRFYWIKSKIEESSALAKAVETYKHSFVTLDHFLFSELQERMLVYPAFPENNPKVDGILFFHRAATYVHSRTPLVTWLNPFMLPDILKMDVAPNYFNEKPPQYNQMEVVYKPE